MQGLAGGTRTQGLGYHIVGASINIHNRGGAVCESVCVLMYVGVSVCMNTSSSSLSLVSLSFHLVSVILYSPYIPFSMKLLPRAARRPRVRFPIVGSAVSPLPYLLKVLPLLVRGADSGAQRWDFLDGSREALIHLCSL